MTQIFPPVASAATVTLADLLACVQVKQTRSRVARQPHLTSLETQDPIPAGPMEPQGHKPSQGPCGLGSQPTSKKT